MASTDLFAQNSKGYYPGDWVSYTRTRYVTSVAVGWNDIYFGTMGGIIRYGRSENRWKDPITTSDGLVSNEIWRLAVDRENDVIYAETPLGVYSYHTVWQDWTYEGEFPYHLERSDLRKYPNLEIFHLDPGYFFTYDLNKPFISDPVFREYPVQDAVEDDWDHLWIGTYGHGVMEVDLNSYFVTHRPTGLFQENTQSIYADGDVVWFGGKSMTEYDNAITMWDRDDDLWEYYESRYEDWISSDEVNVIAGNDEYVFIGTDYGLVAFEKDEERFRSFTKPLGLRSNEIFSLYVEDSMLFVGGKGTIDVLLIPRDSIFSLNPPIAPFGKVYWMSHIGKRFLAGTEYGLYIFDERTFEWSRFDDGEGNFFGAVLHFAEDSKGDIWFATIDGVFHLDADLNEVERFLTRHDLKGWTPHRLALTDKLLWIGTDNGVLRYNRVNRLWETYTTNDGLIDNYINDMMLEGDYIWFATPEGVTRYYWNNPLRIRGK